MRNELKVRSQSTNSYHRLNISKSKLSSIMWFKLIWFTFFWMFFQWVKIMWEKIKNYVVNKCDTNPQSNFVSLTIISYVVISENLRPRKVHTTGNSYKRTSTPLHGSKATPSYSNCWRRGLLGRYFKFGFLYYQVVWCN